MNTTEQYLKKQNDRLAAQNAVLLRAFENLLGENEYLASVACGFAWDLSTTLGHFWVGTEVPATTQKLWADAVAAVQAQNDKAQGITRGLDGSIISVLPRNEAKP